MRKNTWIPVLLVVVFSLVFIRFQSSIVKERAGRRVEEKILMLSNRPEITKILSLGHDSTVADLLWIRAIQYFGGNFSTLNKEGKKEGLINLFRNIVALDPHFASAYQFGGFVMNESIKDPELAIGFLIEGADNNPEVWRLRFDAGFIAFYHKEDFDFAKRMFIQTVYGTNYSLKSSIQGTGFVEGFRPDSLRDDDPLSETKLNPKQGSITINLGEPKSIGRINILQQATAQQSFQCAFSPTTTDAASYQVIPNVTASGIYSITPPITAQFIRLDHLQTTAEDGLFTLNEIEIHGPPRADVPSYVERMAYEMDRAAGRFRAAWDQYVRYFVEAMNKGDEISAQLAATKLDDIYTNLVSSIFDEAIQAYRKAEGKLPSPRMHELFEGGYIQQVVMKRMAEDERFQADIYPVLVGQNGNLYNMTTTWDNRTPYIMLQLPAEEITGKEWIITTRESLENEQKIKLDSLQKLVDQYKEEEGKLPADWNDLKKGKMFNASEDLFKDPLGGEFLINPSTGKVEAVNPVY